MLVRAASAALRLTGTASGADPVTRSRIARRVIVSHVAGPRRIVTCGGGPAGRPGTR